MKSKYRINMTQLLDENLRKRTEFFNYAHIKGNKKRIKSNRSKYLFDITSPLVLSCLELFHRVEGTEPPYEQWFAVNKPAFIGFDRIFTKRFTTFIELLELKIKNAIDNDCSEITLSYAQICILFDILTYSSVIHNKLKNNKVELLKLLPHIKVDLKMTLESNNDLQDRSIFLDVISIREIKKAGLVYKD